MAERHRDEDDDDDYDDEAERAYRRRRLRREPPPDIGDDAAVRMLLPVGRSGWAIAAGYLGLLSVLCIFAPFALLTGVLAIVEMKRNPKKHGMGRAIFGVVMGAIGTIILVFAVLGIILEQVNRR